VKSQVLGPVMGLAALALAACGGAAAPASSPAAPASSAAAAKPSTAASAGTSAKPAASAAASAKPAASGAAATSANGPIKIGWVSSLTGSLSPAGKPMDEGFKMAIAEAGDKAGGRDIQILTEDEASNPKDGLDKVKKLVEQDKVDLLAGLILTPSTYASIDYIQTAAPRKVMLVGTNAGANDMDTTKKSDYFVRVAFSNAQANIPMAGYVYNDLGIRKVYDTYTDFAAGPEKVEVFATEFKKLGGTIVGTDKPPQGSTDFASYLTKIKASDAQATYNFEPGADGVAFTKQYAQFIDKNKIKYLGAGDNVDESNLGAEGLSAVGAITTLHYYSTLENPENKAFVANFRSKYNGETPGSFAVQGYDGGKLIVDALNKTNGNTDPKALLGAMLGAKWNSPRGPVTISPDYHDIIQNIYVAETRNVNGRPQNVVVKTFEQQLPVEK
jgi:branched-chain amino acid transport system substrate-binding protein